MLECAVVRSLLLSFLLVSACLLPAAAETIHLKNGRSILADSVREANGHIEYQIGDDTYAVAKASVDHIDTGGAPPRAGGSTMKDAVPISTPNEDISRSAEVADKLIRDGHVDEQAIAAVEKIGSNELSAAAYFVAARFEYHQGSRDSARRYLERGLSFRPDDAAILDLYVATLIKLGRAKEAVAYGERATRVAPNSADSFYLLGSAYFFSDRTADAVRAWKRSLELRPDANVRAALERAERESSAESSFTESDTSHFNFHYEGGQTSDQLRRQITETLETHYNELVGELGITPRDSISVSLYTNQAYFDVTQAPAWSAALNDGKLRIPVEGLTGVTSSLSQVLKHELAHSFIREITRNRCPAWLNEGIAQEVEARSTSSYGSRLARLYAAQRQVPLSALEGGWTNLSSAEAGLAYAEGLVAVEYIRDTYGMSDVTRILKRLGEGASTEVALRGTIHGGYADLEEGIAAYLKKNYGP